MTVGMANKFALNLYLSEIQTLSSLTSTWGWWDGVQGWEWSHIFFLDGFVWVTLAVARGSGPRTSVARYSAGEICST